MVAQEGSGPPAGQEPSAPPEAPYPPENHSLGEVPNMIPDIPITAVFLFLYVVFAIVHFVILKKNKMRGHKFVFSGAMLVFCCIRVVTMSLRITWACFPRNINLGIAATIFVYAGSIILYIINWFFAQRVIRAQHPRFGWSQSYRAFHRLGLLLLILCLLMAIVCSVQQFFTRDRYTLDIDRIIQRTGIIYISVFCFAPIILVGLSLIVPTKRTEKFGAGRLRNNIAILLFAAAILSAGQVFRCITDWLPSSSLRNAKGQTTETPWYFTKAVFYTLGFTTELIVVIFYALCRFDLRFHIPNGAKGPGEYRAGRDQRYHMDVIGNEKNLKRSSSTQWAGMYHANSSSDTLHEYEASIFDDARTLADSLRYPSSIMEVDPKTGHWKVKRISSTPSIMSRRTSHEPSLWSPDRDTLTADVPPVPNVPADWPLRDSQLPQIRRGSFIPVMEHQNRGSSSRVSTTLINEYKTNPYNSPESSDAIAAAIAKLEANSETNKDRRFYKSPAPPDYDSITPVRERRSGSDIPRKHLYSPNTRASSTPASSSQCDSNARPASDLPKKHSYIPRPATPITNQGYPSVSTYSTSSDLSKERTYMPYRPGSDLPTKYSYSPGSDLPRKQSYSTYRSGSDLPINQTYTPSPELPSNNPYSSSSQFQPQQFYPPAPDHQRRQSHTSHHSSGLPPIINPRSRAASTSNSSAAAEEEFRRFSFEAPIRSGGNGYEGSLNESERSLERRSRK
ncbi:hypothetical protein CC78DRAFT_565807 [Lojkania enalia]|uniref:Uncharacterized protein n=1 Tax=Lojkania enalia TaxID=147567 RepID=A0A9P4KHB0_9PLEO|nr:hypothetical protein CC78DRAFT_565807 [Didymosphaeria enalia]